jgi:hypothetical protein
MVVAQEHLQNRRGNVRGMHAGRICRREAA